MRGTELGFLGISDRRQLDRNDGRCRSHGNGGDGSLGNLFCRRCCALPPGVAPRGDKIPAGFKPAAACAAAAALAAEIDKPPAGVALVAPSLMDLERFLIPAARSCSDSKADACRQEICRLRLDVRTVGGSSVPALLARPLLEEPLLFSSEARLT